MRWSPGCQCCGGPACCDTYTTATITLASFGGCFAWVNGTYSVTPSDPCEWSHIVTNTLPGSSCTTGFCEYQAAVPPSLPAYYYHDGELQIVVTVASAPVSPGSQVISCDVNILTYRYEFTGGFCGRLADSLFLVSYERTDCSDGSMSLISTPGAPTNGLTNYSYGTCSVAS